jgi:CCCH-type zinc finger
MASNTSTNCSTNILLLYLPFLLYRKMERSHVIQSTQPIPNFQDVTNLANQQTHYNSTPEMHARIQRNPPTIHNLEFRLPSGSHPKTLKQPQSVQSQPQMRANHCLVYPNSGYSVQAIGRNIFVSGLPHQRSNGYNGQVSQQDPWQGPQGQVNHGYNAHGTSHYERRYGAPVPTQQCRYYLQGRCRFGPVCKFRHE